MLALDFVKANRETVERLPFSVGRAVNTPYRHDAFQPRYLVSASLDRTIAEVLSLTPERLLAL
jgi:phenylalanine-4-hydroxylase